MEDNLKKDEEYMRRALMEAQAAFDEDEIPVGAVIVCRDRIISSPQSYGDAYRCYRPCRDAGDYIRSEHAGRKIPERLYPLCHR